MQRQPPLCIKYSSKSSTRRLRKGHAQPLPPLRCRAYDSRLLPARICRLQSQEPIEREGSGTAREEEEEDRSPGELVGPGVGIHKRLDDRENTQGRQRG